MNKRNIFFVCGIPILLFIIREIYGAADYVYKLTLTRGDKLFLANCTDLENEEKALKEDMDREGHEIEEWLKNIKAVHCNIKSLDGLALFGKIYIQSKYTDNWVVIVHGYGGDCDLMTYAAKRFFERGYNVVVPDLRCHGNSEGDYIGMGWRDRLDIIEWCRKIINGNAESKIVLYGVSMGGATVLMASGEKLPPNIKAIIADCSYESVDNIISYQLKEVFHIPPHPFVDVVSMVYRKKTGYGFRDASVIRQVRKCSLPILFCHGDSDRLVPTNMVYKLYNNAKCKKDLMVIKGAGHGVSAMIGKRGYWDRVFKFINESGIS